MKSEFVKKQEIKPRQLKGWGLDLHGGAFLEVLLNSFPIDYKTTYQLEGKLEEAKESVKENETRFFSFLLRVLEVVDFWERILEIEDLDVNLKIERFKSGHQFLLDELAKIEVRPDGPKLGKLPRRGKDVVEGTEERADLPEGTICGVINKCYLFEERILRKAKVISIKKGGK